MPKFTQVLFWNLKNSLTQSDQHSDLKKIGLVGLKQIDGLTQNYMQLKTIDIDPQFMSAKVRREMLIQKDAQRNREVKAYVNMQ